MQLKLECLSPTLVFILLVQNRMCLYLTLECLLLILVFLRLLHHRLCLQSTLQCRLVTLILLLCLHSECVYTLHWCAYSLHYGVYCLSLYFCCFYIASVSIAYNRVSSAGPSLSIAFTQRVCLQLTLECIVLTLVFLLPLHSECVYSLPYSVYCLL